MHPGYNLWGTNNLRNAHTGELLRINPFAARFFAWISGYTFTQNYSYIISCLYLEVKLNSQASTAVQKSNFETQWSWHCAVFLLSGLFWDDKEKECQSSGWGANNKVWILLQNCTTVEVAGKLIIEFHKVGFHKVYLISNTTVLTFLIKWTYWGKIESIKPHNSLVAFFPNYFLQHKLMFHGGSLRS